MPKAVPEQELLSRNALKAACWYTVSKVSLVVCAAGTDASAQMIEDEGASTRLARVESSTDRSANLAQKSIWGSRRPKRSPLL